MVVVDTQRIIFVSAVLAFYTANGAAAILLRVRFLEIFWRQTILFIEIVSRYAVLAS